MASHRMGTSLACTSAATSAAHHASFSGAPLVLRTTHRIKTAGSLGCNAAQLPWRFHGRRETCQHSHLAFHAAAELPFMLRTTRSGSLFSLQENRGWQGVAAATLYRAEGSGHRITRYALA